ncbi:hypothetical protein GALL_193580 [mine drainage metagenome]|uniref:Uncharacterized protein n=1 Tax=mine drainage metagenome TaxID=410659 RepID=A0A1J5S310_9ZZZZ
MLIKPLSYFAVLFSAIVFTTPVLAAEDASMHEVYLAAEAGKFTEAQAMMDKVLHDHPNSAKAHYVEAELLAKQGHLSAAANELNAAERLKPGLPFVKPQTLQKLKSQIASSHLTTQSTGNNNAQHYANSDMPWKLIFLGLGLIVFIYFAVKWMTQRNQTLIPANGYSGGMNNGNPQPYGMTSAPMPMPSSSGLGSGILGGLATGAALGAGMVAGEALMHHFTDGEHSNNNNFMNDDPVNNSFSTNDLGGSDFGVSDSSSWDDNSGGDDWS